MGLYAGVDKEGAAAWFQDCEFGASIATVPGEVAVESRECRVYSNTLLPNVWDLDLGRQVGAWTLALDDPDGTMGLPNAFADVETRPSSAFLRPTDYAFRRVLIEHSITERVQAVLIGNMPEGTAYRASNPYASMSDGAADGAVTSHEISLLAGLAGSGALCVLAALLVGWCTCIRKRFNDDDGGKVPDPVPAGSGIPSALATNSHWATENSATFMGTMCQPDAPAPDRDAPAAKKLEFLHNQLNGMTKDAVILERFLLLGPNQRRQGGAHPLLRFFTHKAVHPKRPIAFSSAATEALHGWRGIGAAWVGTDWPQ